MSNQSLDSSSDPNLKLYSNIDGANGFICGFSKARIGFKIP